MVGNGDQTITHCKICNSQFIEAQKIGDWIFCDDCDCEFKLSVKQKDG